MYFYIYLLTFFKIEQSGGRRFDHHFYLGATHLNLFYNNASSITSDILVCEIPISIYWYSYRYFFKLKKSDLILKSLLILFDNIWHIPYNIEDKQLSNISFRLDGMVKGGFLSHAWIVIFSLYRYLATKGGGYKWFLLWNLSLEFLAE